jgi:hypothetical protein
MSEHQKTQAPIHFDMAAPHGARIYPTMDGCRIEFQPSMRPVIESWLQNEAVRFGLVATAPEEMVTCPRCEGKLVLNGETPVFCTLCHGAMRVTKTVAANFRAASKQTIVRKQEVLVSPPVSNGSMGTPPPKDRFDQLRSTIATQNNPVAKPIGPQLPVDHTSDTIPSTPPDAPIPEVPLAPPGLLPGMSVATTQLVEDDEDEFVAPQPGDPDFIGPLQEG